MPKKTSGLVRLGWVTAFLFFTCGAFAQNVVTGKIINKKDNAPVPGANVQVRGTTTIVQSGADGSFSIKLPNASGTLRISAVGFAVQEVSVTAGAVLGDIALAGSASTLHYVVVIGYTSPRKED